MTLPNTGSYAYASDIGTPSLAQLEALCRSSGIGITVTSGYRNIAGQNNGWHLYSNAIDVVSTQADMTQLGNYLAQYSFFLLELIHTNPDGSGSYVKNGQVVNAAYYGSDTVAQHTDHVHVAATVSGVVAAAEWAKANRGNLGTGTFPVPSTTSGGSKPSNQTTSADSNKTGCAAWLGKAGLTTASAILLPVLLADHPSWWGWVSPLTAITMSLFQ